jgi:hypothetical protein
MAGTRGRAFLRAVPRCPGEPGRPLTACAGDVSRAAPRRIRVRKMLALGPPRQALDPEVAAPKNWSGSLSSRRGDGDGDVDEAARLGPDGRKYITNSGKRWAAFVNATALRDNLPSRRRNRWGRWETELLTINHLKWNGINGWHQLTGIDLSPSRKTGRIPLL